MKPGLTILRIVAVGATIAMAQAAFAQDSSGGGTSYPNGITPDSQVNPANPETPALANLPTGNPMHINSPQMTPFAFSPIQGSPESAAIDVATGAGGFETFSEAMTATNLYPTLRGPGPFTVFAPTDAAFARMDRGPLDNLLAPRNRMRLQRVMAYHIVPQLVNMDDVQGRQMYATLAGPPVIISRSANGTFTVNGANVVERDIPSANGNIDVIDSVIFPGGRGPGDFSRDASH